MQEEKKYKYPLKIEKINTSNVSLLKLTQVEKLPSIVDLRKKMPPIYDQGQLGSCTANAICALAGYNNLLFVGSRLFVYYNERVLENTVNEDSGATLEDGMISLKKYGVCKDTLWPYNIQKFAVRPTENCYANAKKHLALEVTNVTNDILSIKQSLFHGYPLVVGIMIYESFETQVVAKTGMVPMPLPTETLLGGHAVVIVGYDDTKKLWIMRNSWGASWGIKGYFYLPYEYLTSPMASDLWNIIKMKQ